MVDAQNGPALLRQLPSGAVGCFARLGWDRRRRPVGAPYVSRNLIRMMAINMDERRRTIGHDNGLSGGVVSSNDAPYSAGHSVLLRLNAIVSLVAANGPVLRTIFSSPFSVATDSKRGVAN